MLEALVGRKIIIQPGIAININASTQEHNSEPVEDFVLEVRGLNLLTYQGWWIPFGSNKLGGIIFTSEQAPSELKPVDHLPQLAAIIG